MFFGKRVISMLICCSMLLGLLSGCSKVLNPEPAELIQPNREHHRAISCEIIPEAWGAELGKIITFKQYAAVLSKIVERWDPERIGEWQNIISLAAESEEPMEREDGILMLSYLWILMGRGHEEFVYIEDDPATGEKIYSNHRNKSIYTDRIYEMQINELSGDYPCFPNWRDTVYYSVYKTNYMFGAVWTFPFIASPISNESIVSLDENDSLGLKNPLTIGDAVSMAVRMADYCLIELNPYWREYVHLSETGTYNRDIITDALLNTPSNLPEVTQSVFPSEWKGAGIVVRKGFAEEYMHYEESDVVFLRENGFNFARLYLAFSTFRYPDYPEDPYLINVKELEELDQLFAWCIQNDIHLQISMRGYMDEHGVFLKDAPQKMPENDAAWALTQAYWEMLTKRYAGISSKYLSFDVCNEPQPDPEELEKHKEKLGEMVSKMRSIDPERVLLYSQWNMGNIPWAEAIASLGIGIGCHPYMPTFITVGGNPQTSPYALPVWPQPYFPTGKVMGGEAPIQFEGDIAGSEMRVHIWYSDENPILKVCADGNLVERITPTGTRGEDGEYYYYDKIYSVQIPENIEKVTLEVEEGFARIDNIIFEKNGISTNMVPCDTLSIPDNTDPLPIIVHGDGTYSNSENIVYDTERIYQTAIEPYRKIAQQYNVGFIVNEFGMFGVNIDWDIDIVITFHEAYLEMLESKEIPWSYCEIANQFPKHLVVLFFEEAQWANATEEDITYTLSDGSQVTLRVCKELLDLFRKYTMES